MTMTFSAFDALLAGRFSCRAFRPDPVPRAVIERILGAACKVPSWCNAQPWQAVITSGAETDALRAAREGYVAKDFDFGDFRDRWEAVFDDATMLELNRRIFTRRNHQPQHHHPRAPAAAKTMHQNATTAAQRAQSLIAHRGPIQIPRHTKIRNR